MSESVFLLTIPVDRWAPEHYVPAIASRAVDLADQLSGATSLDELTINAGAPSISPRAFRVDATLQWRKYRRTLATSIHVRATAIGDDEEDLATITVSATARWKSATPLDTPAGGEMAGRLERNFEDEVVEVLTTESGWALGAAQDLDLATGINSADLVAFVGHTQADEWERWLTRFPDAADAQVALRQRVAAEIDHRGTIDVLRNGVRGNGCKFSLCFFKPAHGLTPLLVERYEANRLTVTRQQRYSTAHTNTIDLADALTTETARIILCTLQTFSHVDAALAVGRRSYAVIVDEAHSSQTGEAAKDLKGVLGAASEEERLAIAEKEEAGEPVTGEDRIAEAVAARATQKNLSFFAFTATPKARTVELFGTLDPATGLKAPFHVYSMRQAIEEGFILDVLRRYTTFDVFWKVRQARPGDPEVPKAKASAQIAKTISLHDHNVARRAKIVVDHFREHIRPQLDGTAKAMVVTASRLHAVRYKQAIDRYLADHHLTDTRAVVAFSGKVTDPDDPHGGAWTETSMNGFPESETARRFKGEDGFPVDGYQVLIVAEKYQTGFDAPRLLAMYVDKKLEGVNAVQTLARLNRSFPGKGQPFVLDFRNDAEAITDAFRPWYDTTIVDPVDANVLYRFQGTLQAAGVFDQTDVDHYWEVFAPVAANDRKGNGALYAALAGPRQRFAEDLDDDGREQFRSDLDAYCRAYGFLSQIVDWTDADLEKLSYGRDLYRQLHPSPGL